LEFDAQHAGEKVCCPHCGKETVLFVPPARLGKVLKRHATLLVICTVAILFGLWQWAGLRRRNAEMKRDEPKYVSPSERAYNLREMAQRAMVSECSNLVGFHRIVGNPYVFGESDEPKKWDGRAEAEFVNKVGGIERTNLRFRFSAYSGTVLARAETEYERVERWRREAPEEVRKSSTNYVVGFTRINRIEVSGDYSSYDSKKWQATATVDFVNTTGGIEHTNLPFRFEAYSDYIYAEDNFPTLMQRLDEDLAKIHSEAKLSRELLDKAHDEALRRLAAGTVGGPRTWTFQKGAKLVGTFVRFQGSNAIIISRASDGQDLTVQLAYLCEYDNDYLDLTQKKSASP
jgi:hypothetical protein